MKKPNVALPLRGSVDQTGSSAHPASAHVQLSLTGTTQQKEIEPKNNASTGLNSWSYWRPIYHLTWAIAQRSSYKHYKSVVADCHGKVLDIGTGTGEYIQDLPKRNTYTFTDIDAPSLAVAEKRAKERLGNGTYKILNCDGVHALKAITNQDLISIIHVISVVPDPEELLKLAIEKLAPGGKIVVYISRFSKYSKWLCNPLFRALGFKILDMRKMEGSWQYKRAGLLNDCYIYENNSERIDPNET